MNLNKLNNSHLFSLKNKVTIVAGASKGIGLAISKGFKQNGAFVIGLSRKKIILIFLIFILNAMLPVKMI